MEFCDIFNEHGCAVGSEAIDVIHQKKLAHRAAHIWVAVELKGVPHMLLSIRSSIKKMHPSKVDCLVSGHYKSLEGLRDIDREIKEEIGIMIPSNNIKFVGVRYSTTVYNREAQYIFIAHIQPNAASEMRALEADQLLAVELTEMVKFARGEEKTSMPVTLISNNGQVESISKLSLEDFIDADASYYADVAKAIIGMSEGEFTYLYDFPLSIIDYIELDDQTLFSMRKPEMIINLDEQLLRVFSNGYETIRAARALRRCDRCSGLIKKLLLYDIEDKSNEQIIYRVALIGFLNDSENELLGLIKSNNSYVRAFSYLILSEKTGLHYKDDLINGFDDISEVVVEALSFSLGWNQGKNRKNILLERSIGEKQKHLSAIYAALEMYK